MQIHDVSAFVDARGFSTTYVYGPGRELKQVRYPDGQTETRTYDSSNRLKTIADARGGIAKFSYDAAGRTNHIEYAGSTAQPDIHITYNADGRIRTMTDEVGTTIYTYTSNRLVHSVTYSFTGLASAQTLTYTYNPDNSVASLNWASGPSPVTMWTYNYDAAGRITKASDSAGTSSTYSYDHEGKLSTHVNSNGTALVYSYVEGRGWPSQMIWGRGGTAFSSFALTYDGGSNTVGNLSHVTEGSGAQVSYGYDALYRLTSEARTGSGAYATTTGYDVASNIVARNGAMFAAYDGANKVSGLTGGSVTYDKAGNVLSASGADLPATTLTWDARNKLRSQSQGTLSIGYKYNGSGQRAVRTLSSGSITYYVFAGNTLIGEVTNGVPSVAYLWGADGLSSERILASGRALFYHFGPQGETRQLSDAAGNTVDAYFYNSYGELLQSTGSDPNPFRYGGKVGYYADGGFGLLLAGARWYSPNLMRWLSRDPIRYRGGDNEYAYTSGNPVGATDPSGLQDFPFIIGPPGSPTSIAGGIALGIQQEGQRQYANAQRGPDYILANVNIAVPNAITGTTVGWSGTVAIDRYGDVFGSPIGWGAGKSLTFVSGSLTANWLDQCDAPSQEQLSAFLSEHGFGGSIGAGFGSTQSYTPGSGWASGVGLMSPQVGASYNYSFPLGSAGIHW